MPEPNVSDPSYKVWKLCFHVRGQLEGKKTFMDNINVVNAINRGSGPENDIFSSSPKIIFECSNLLF